jgi:hypothetical protein
MAIDNPFNYLPFNVYVITLIFIVIVSISITSDPLYQELTRGIKDSVSFGWFTAIIVALVMWLFCIYGHFTAAWVVYFIYLFLVFLGLFFISYAINIMNKYRDVCPRTDLQSFLDCMMSKEKALM